MYQLKYSYLQQLALKNPCFIKGALHKIMQRNMNCNNNAENVMAKKQTNAENELSGMIYLHTYPCPPFSPHQADLSVHPSIHCLFSDSIISFFSYHWTNILQVYVLKPYSISVIFFSAWWHSELYLESAMKYKTKFTNELNICKGKVL